MKKIIGIPGYKSSESFGAGINHLAFISRFGEARIIMPWENLVDVDLLYLPGGLDTAPLSYGEEPSFKTSNQDVFKEHFLTNKLGAYIDKGVKILGVCLGAQMLAVKFGGKLTQDLLFHEQSSGRWQEAHEVYAIDNSKYKFKVNSHHHQCLTINNCSDNIIPIMLANNNDSYISGDGAIVEQFSIKNKQIYGIQWHPEELYDHHTVELMNKLTAK